MSLDLVVLTPGSAQDFDQALRVYYEEEEGAPEDPDAIRLAQFASELDRDYGADNWPFSGDPILMATHVLLTVAPEWWTEVVPAIVKRAHRHGLAVLDPQEEALFHPGQEYEVSVSVSGGDQAQVSAEHCKKIITAAARDILRPMGIAQKGKSSLWHDDRGWWAGLIEFKPTSYGHGEVNVAVQWLWDIQDGSDVILGVYHYPHDHDISAGGFIEYQSDEQFTPLVVKMVQKASRRALDHRKLFPTVDAAARVLGKRKGVDWDIDAGIAHGLVGEQEKARRRFQHYIDWDESEDGQAWRGEWMDARAERVRMLLELVGRTQDFRRLIAANIRQVREALKLDPEIDLPF
jgi:hypothetical protein